MVSTLLMHPQCALPVFDGLLTGDNHTSVMRLLFICAHWHGLAKLRMHSDPTLQLLDDLTTEIGSSLREFSSVVCPSYKTRELPRELEARHRRAAKQSKADDVAARGVDLENTQTPREKRDQTGPRIKKYNIDTYKHHSLGDYINEIRERGTTDSYSTEPVSYDIGFIAGIMVYKSLPGRIRTPNSEGEVSKDRQKAFY